MAYAGNGLRRHHFWIVSALFLVIAGILLLIDGIKALNRHRQRPTVGLPAGAK